MAVPERETTAALQPLELGANLQAGIVAAKRQNQALMQLMAELLESGVDYDQIPGTPKPTLLQPGAQQLCTVFHFCPSYQVADKTEILDEGREFLSYIVTCRLIHRESGLMVAEGIGSANSREVKHRYRWEGRDDNRHRVENPEVLDLQNTLVKMAKKRALVDATLNATGASRLFTQDLEDLQGMAQGGERTARPAGNRPSVHQGGGGGDKLRSDKQVGAIMGLLTRKFGLEADDARQSAAILAGAELDSLTVKQASDLIGLLNKITDADALSVAISDAAARQPAGGGQQ